MAPTKCSQTKWKYRRFQTLKTKIDEVNLRINWKKNPKLLIHCSDILFKVDYSESIQHLLCLEMLKLHFHVRFFLVNIKQKPKEMLRLREREMWCQTDFHQVKEDIQLLILVFTWTSGIIMAVRAGERGPGAH